MDVFADDEYDKYQQYKKNIVLPSSSNNIEENETQETVKNENEGDKKVLSPVVSVRPQEEQEGENGHIAGGEEVELPQHQREQTIGIESFGFVENDDGERINAEDINRPQKGEPRKGKQDFSAVQGDFYAAPKLNKTALLVIVLSFVVGFVLIFNVVTAHRKKQLEEEKAQRDTTTEYNPSFGDYKARAYKEDQKIQEEIKVLKDTTPPKPVFKQPPRYSQGPAEVRAAPERQINQAEEDAKKSPLQKNVSGFGRAASMRNSGSDVINPLNAEELMKYVPMQATGSPNLGMSKEQYTDQRVSQISKMLGASGANSTDKNESINNGRFSQNGAYVASNTGGGRISPLDDATLFPGTIIHAVLVSGINTDYPAPITARVIENVYDSKTGMNLLIPQGSILQGDYSSSSFGIGKVQIAWTGLTVNFDDIAYYITLGSMAGVDQQGNAGIKGSIDEHYWQWLKAAGIMSLFTVLNSEIAYQTKDIGNGGLRELIDDNQAIVNKIGNKLVDRALDIQPTVIVKNGTRVSVSVNTSLQMVPLQSIPPVQRYTREGL